MWEQYRGTYFIIGQELLTAAIAVFTAVVIIWLWIAHVYATIWVRGAVQAMASNQVAGGGYHCKWLWGACLRWAEPSG
jgi:cytochrome b subunit of formate dehydrogenase